MKRLPPLIISILILFLGCYVPNKKERAQKKFEVFFAKFKAAYPADYYEYHYSNYSPLYKLPKPVPFEQSVKKGMLGEGPITYTQTVHCISFNQQGDTIRNVVFIQYNEKLDVVTFGTINP